MLSILSKTQNKNDISITLLKRKDTLTNDSYPYMLIGLNFAQSTFFVPVQFSINDNIDREHLIIGATHINGATIDMEHFQTFNFGVEKKDMNIDFTLNMTYETSEIIQRDEK